MKYKRVWRILLLFLLPALILAGCSADTKAAGKDGKGKAAQGGEAAKTAAADRTEAGKDAKMQQKERMIKVIGGDNEILFVLNDSSVSRSFYRQLPLTVAVENYGSNEKVFQPPEKLDGSNAREGACPAGSIAYFSPWNNVCLYYGDAPRYTGLYVMGKAVKGAERIGSLSGRIRIIKQEAEPAAAVK